MKYITFILLLALFAACGKKTEQSNNQSSSTNSESTVNNKTTEPRSNSENNSKKLPVIGSYTGGFTAKEFDDSKDFVYENRITVFIDSISGDMMYGHSVVAGNSRPFKGKFTKDGENYKADVTEPGDDKYDGVFSFSTVIDSKNTNEIFLKGSWRANDKKLPVTLREYNLLKTDFAYDPQHSLPENVQWAELYEASPKFPDKVEQLTNAVTKLNPSVQELTKKDVENLYKGDLEIIRNSIYARHGYSFKTRRIRFIFDQFVPWYMPVSTDVRNELTEIEKKNIDLIKRYEEHAEKYYDEYGR